jgi:hypothetical protein
MIDHSKKSVSPEYLKYLISSLVLVNDWIEKFGVGGDDEIINQSNKISNSIDSIMNRMNDMGIEVDELLNESFNVSKHIREFKIKKLLDNE